MVTDVHADADVFRGGPAAQTSQGIKGIDMAAHPSECAGDSPMWMSLWSPAGRGGIYTVACLGGGAGASSMRTLVWSAEGKGGIYTGVRLCEPWCVCSDPMIDRFHSDSMHSGSDAPDAASHRL